jgi:hypothetical protein
MDLLIFALAYAIILGGFIIFGWSDAEHDPQEKLLFNDHKSFLASKLH